jgi:ribosomal protein S26
MDYMKNGRRKTVDGRELIFIRCDRAGNEIPEERLRGLGISNPTIEQIVGDVAVRSADGPNGEFSAGIISG